MLNFFIFFLLPPLPLVHFRFIILAWIILQLNFFLRFDLLRSGGIIFHLDGFSRNIQTHVTFENNWNPLCFCIFFRVIEFLSLKLCGSLVFPFFSLRSCYLTLSYFTSPQKKIVSSICVFSFTIRGRHGWIISERKTQSISLIHLEKHKARSSLR
jgi:hypothetical protein